jgi:predicted RNase H-like nuclease
MAGKASGDAWVAGVDGCPAGWLVAFARSTGREFLVRIVPRFADVLCAPESPRIVAIDIPIGLPEYSEIKGRAPEREVRPLVGRRRSSVFRVPSRATIYAGVDTSIPNDNERYLSCCAIARATSLDKKAFGKQTFCLFPKIVEVDMVLRAHNQSIDHVFEIHPELAFWRLNADRALDEPKKRKGRCHEPGLTLRRRLLVEAGFPATVVNRNPPKGASPDDLLDALACTAIARRIQAGLARPFPDRPKRDSFGLPMAIWA